MSERPRLRRTKRKVATNEAVPTDVEGGPPAASEAAQDDAEHEPDAAPSEPTPPAPPPTTPVTSPPEPGDDAGAPPLPAGVDPSIMSLWGQDIDEASLTEEERAALSGLGAASTKPVNLPWMGYRVERLQQNPIAAAGLGAALLGAFFLVPKMFFFAIGLGVVAIAGGALGNSAADKEKRSGLLVAAFSISIGLAVIVVGVTGLLAEGDSTTGAGGTSSGPAATVATSSYNLQQTACSVAFGTARLDGLITTNLPETKSLTIRASFLAPNGRTTTGKTTVEVRPGAVVVFRIEAPLADASSVTCSVSGVS